MVSHETPEFSRCVRRITLRMQQKQGKQKRDNQGIVLRMCQVSPFPRLEYKRYDKQLPRTQSFIRPSHEAVITLD